jgi:DNA-directed RNA polymerase alpha subunit
MPERVVRASGTHGGRFKIGEPALDLDHATIEVRVDGVPRATTQIGRRSILSADVGTIRQLENRVSSLAADIEQRREEALTRVEQADSALAEPLMHANALKNAKAETARIDRLMVKVANPVEHPTEHDTEEPALR